MIAQNQIYFNFEGNRSCCFNTSLELHPYKSLKPSTIRQRLQFTLENTFTLQRYFLIPRTNTEAFMYQLDESLESDEKYLPEPVYAKVVNEEIKAIYRRPQTKDNFYKVISYRPLKITNVLLGVVAIGQTDILLFSLALNEKLSVKVLPYCDEVRMRFRNAQNTKELFNFKQMTGEWVMDTNCLYPVINNQVQDPVRLGDYCVIDDGFIKL